MALAIDASTPAIASTATAAAVTTASFTPPSGSVVVLLIGSNNSGTADTTISSVTNTGTAITWTRRARKNTNAASDGGAGTNGGAEIWTGVGNGGAITVTATGPFSGVGNDKSLQAVVLTGADTSALTHIITATSTSGLPSATLTSCAAGSHVFAVSSDWAQAGLGTAGTGQTIITEYNSAGQITIHNWRTTNTLSGAGSQTMNLTAPAAEQYNLAVIEIKATGAAAPALPPQPVRDRLFPVPRRRAGRALPVPTTQVTVTTQALPPQPVRDRLFPLPRRRQTSTQVVVTVRTLPAQPPRDRIVPLPRRRVTATQPVPAQVVIPTGPQALPPQPGRRRWGFLPRAKARQSQPVPAQVVIVTGPQALPVQPQRDRIVPLPRRRQTSTTVVVTVRPLPPQPLRDRLVPLPLRRSRSTQPVPAQVIVQTAQALPPQPGRRRLRFLPRPRRGVATQLFRVYVISPNDGVPVDGPSVTLTVPDATVEITSPISGIELTVPDASVELTVPAARTEIDVATWKKNDTSPALTGTCKSNGIPANISGSTLELHLKKPSGTVLTKTGTLVDGTNGTWSYQWITGDLNEAGSWWGEPQVTYSNGRIQTFPSFSFAVDDELG